MEYIISTLWFVLECVAFFLFASAFLPYRYNGKQTILTALCICTLSLLNQSLTIPSLARRLCALAFGLCLIVFLFKGRLEQRIFIGLLDYIMIAAMDAIILFCASTVLGVSLDELVWKKGMYTVLVTAGKILSVFLAWLITRLHPFHRIHPLRPKWMLLVSFFPLTSLFMLIALFLICRDQRELTQPVAFFCIFLGIANVAIVYVVSLIERDTEVKQQNNILSQQMEIQTASILALDKAYRQQRQSTHDFQNHLCTISDLLSQKAYETAAKYVQELNQAQTSRILIVNEAETINVIRGKSRLNVDLLNSLVAKCKEEIAELSQEVDAQKADMERQLESAAQEQAEFEKLESWADLYDNCTFEAKKMIVSQLIKAVYVYRDYRLEVEFRVSFDDFRRLCVGCEPNGGRITTVESA